jgi:hypothetical protein
MEYENGRWRNACRYEIRRRQIDDDEEKSEQENRAEQEQPRQQ